MTKARSHVAWTAIERVIDRLKPFDKAVRGTWSKPPGRNEKPNDFYLHTTQTHSVNASLCTPNISIDFYSSNIMDDPTLFPLEFNPFSDSDGIPDGYEVWYSSMMEPIRKLNGDLFFSPLTNDTYKDDDLIEDTLYEPQNGETLGPTFFGPEGSVIALAQRVYFGANSVFGGSADISKITRIQVQLNMSRATNLKLTMEIWDYRLDYISYDPESLSTALENVTIMADEKVTTGASADPAGVGGCATRRNGPSCKKTNDGAHQSAGWHGKSVWTG